jgi:rhodanese-related sulfurtransferase
MKFLSKELFRDMSIIVLTAMVVGISWNYTMLHNAWTGNPVTAEKPSKSAGENSIIPLPLGLMQVKDFYDQHDAVLVDARDKGTYAKGHIEGALSLPLGDADREIAGFLRNHPFAETLIVYCNGFDCHDSLALANKLIQNGYQSVYIYEGGFPEWRDAGYPVAGNEHAR